MSPCQALSTRSLLEQVCVCVCVRWAEERVTWCLSSKVTVSQLWKVCLPKAGTQYEPKGNIKGTNGQSDWSHWSRSNTSFLSTICSQCASHEAQLKTRFFTLVFPFSVLLFLSTLFSKRFVFREKFKMFLAFIVFTIYFCFGNHLYVFPSSVYNFQWCPLTFDDPVTIDDGPGLLWPRQCPFGNNYYRDIGKPIISLQIVTIMKSAFDYTGLKTNC